MQLAKDAYTAAQAVQAAECAKRGPKCRAAQGAVTAARNALATAAPVQVADPGAERLAAMLGIQESTVQLYGPLLLPLGLELGGFIFLAAGLAPRRSEDEIATESAAKPVETTLPAVAKLKANSVATPTKRGTAAYYLARLQRDHPTIALRVAAGELSIYMACVGRHPQGSGENVEVVEARRVPEYDKRHGVIAQLKNEARRGSVRGGFFFVPSFTPAGARHSCAAQIWAIA